MAELTLNGRDVLSLTLRAPREGTWIAQLTVDAEDAIEGAVSLETDGGPTLRGTAVRTGVAGGRAVLQVVGGKGKLGTTLPPRFYRGVTLRVPVGDVVRDAGETLSPGADPALLDRVVVTYWTRVAAPASRALADLAAAQQASWRVGWDGTVWVGRELWPTVEFPYDLVDDAPGDDAVSIATDTVPWGLAPGTVFRDRRVSQVTYEVSPTGTRATASFEPEGKGSDRRKAAADAVIRHSLRELFFLGRYAARLVQQGPDGTLDVVVDDPRVPPMTGIPLRLSLPGMSVRIAPGARLQVGFENAEASRPVAELFESGALQELTIATASGATFKLTQSGNVVVVPGALGSVLLGGEASATFDVAAQGDPAPQAAIAIPPAPPRRVKLAK